MKQFNFDLQLFGRAVSDDPVLKWNYEVKIAGLEGSFGFSKVSGLKHELENTPYAEGGEKHDRQLIGREKVDPVTLEQGSCSLELYDQYKKARDAQDDARGTITIIHKDSAGNEMFTWVLEEAWFKTFETSELEAASSDVAIMKATIIYETLQD